jgi:hypothetical protein
MGVGIFLSHSSKDAASVVTIRDQAEAVGVEVYLFSDDLHPGDNTAQKLQEAMQQCQAVVVLLTSNSAESAYVQQEIGLAEGLGLPIIPLVESGVPPHRLAMLQGRDYIPFDRDGVQPALTELTRVLHGLEQRPAVVAPDRPGSGPATVQLTGEQVVLAITVVALLVLLAYSAGANFGRP